MKFTQQTPIKQAVKARAMLHNYLRKHKYEPVNIIFELYKRLFNCEIWGIHIYKELEQFHLSFINVCWALNLQPYIYMSPTPWSFYVKKLLFEFGFGYVWKSKAAYSYIDHSLFIKHFEQRVNDYLSDITKSNRCFVYKALVKNGIYLFNINRLDIPEEVNLYR